MYITSDRLPLLQHFTPVHRGVTVDGRQFLSKQDYFRERMRVQRIYHFLCFLTLFFLLLLLSPPSEAVSSFQKSSKRMSQLTCCHFVNSCSFLLNSWCRVISLLYCACHDSPSLLSLSRALSRPLLLFSFSQWFQWHWIALWSSAIFRLEQLQDIPCQQWIIESKHRNSRNKAVFKQGRNLSHSGPVGVDHLIMMYKFKTSRDQQQATLFTLASHSSLVVVKAARLQSSHHQQAQSRLLLEFNIHENHDEASSWSAMEHELKGRFDDVVAGDLLPFCSLKVHVYILQAASHVESTIANAVWACLLMHGVPMRRSVFHFEWQDKQERGRCVLDLNQPSRVFSSEANNVIPAQATTECIAFKSQLTAFLSAEWSR